MSLKTLEDVIKIRHHIHSQPELSGEEILTSQTVKNFFRESGIHKVYSPIGKTGFVFEKTGEKGKPIILIRAELDGLPIQEKSSLEYSSCIPGKAHLCGHDGHMAILMAVSTKVFENTQSTILFLFQPAEETGQGAFEMLSDSAFSNLPVPDFVISYHNIPGYPLNQLLLKKGCFAQGSCGMIIRLEGKTSHAAYPEQGNSPALISSEIIEKLETIRTEDLLATVIHVKIGEQAFGTTPGDALIMATLRSSSQEVLNNIKQETSLWIQELAGNSGVSCEISFVEDFPALINHSETVETLIEVAHEENLNYTELEKPFRWSEDFAHFTSRYDGAMFGIGSGMNSPGLHNPDYDFPDELIDPASSFIVSVIRKLEKR